ncbi:hypothetical protein EN943_23120 [Mesorhizobium sp. M7A.F.Ca.US.006.01.1.1]|uniref:hypothetical protein n=1 Tax=Mesorhizobium sp. M7A.F.Ca.US.006.01.1.1 TaxID=2496707 RepID=UPI000FCA8A24|nr:hypothetical protein [Mesorhizobium sp. M7A.F.Ca.US.006.01.1.1]RUZ74677.1 hypothetical protein EN943_23120 [Mesorhizobium sp. M7A.F.Ca.US.006.01.1.1]
MSRAKLSDVDSKIVQTTWVFAKDRLMDREVLEWALEFADQHLAERAALRQLFDHHSEQVAEPYRQAWRWVFEFWDRPQAETSYERLLMKRDLKAGASHAETIRLIVMAVKPWLKIESRGRLEAIYNEVRVKRPKSIDDLLRLSVSSGERLTPEDLDLNSIKDRDFLFELANSLNSALLSGLNLAARIGQISQRADNTNWQVHRVYFVPPAQFPDGGGEPDRYHDGFAPSTKLLFAVLEQLATVDRAAAQRVIASWDIDRWTLYKRLWAAAARNGELLTSSAVEKFFQTLDDREFWSAGSYPEFAETRALRWNSLSLTARVALERRLLKGEPRRLLPKRIEPAEATLYVTRRAVAELQRIQVTGAILSEKTQTWLNTAIAGLDNPPAVNSVTDGFNVGVRLVAGERPSGQRFHNVPRAKLLEELEKNLGDDSWDDRSREASDFIGHNPGLILELLAESETSTAQVKIWQSLGYYFRPTDLNATADSATDEDRAKIPLAIRMCQAIVSLPQDTLHGAIDGLTSWMSFWERLLKDSNHFLSAWLSLWPSAVMEVNESQKIDKSLSDRSFASPAGNMARAFMAACPQILRNTKPFAVEPWPRVLQAIEETVGEARLQVQYQLITNLGYFLAAEPAWARRNLLMPLRDAEGEAIELWKAFSQGHLLGREFLGQIASALIKATMNTNLSSDIRGNLARLVTWSEILDRRDGVAPTIGTNFVQQMFRMGGDQVRSQALRAMKEYMKSGEKVSEQSADRYALISSLFVEIWPKELTLNTRRVSDALADLPATAGAKFADAVELVTPYLTPFDCWSLWEYGVLAHDDNGKTIQIVRTAKDAYAFLVLLDKTIGGEDGAVIPNGLDKALQHISLTAPGLEKDVRYQRLLTLSRR